MFARIVKVPVGMLRNCICLPDNKKRTSNKNKQNGCFYFPFGFSLNHNIFDHQCVLTRQQVDIFAECRKVIEIFYPGYQKTEFYISVCDLATSVYDLLTFANLEIWAGEMKGTLQTFVIAPDSMAFHSICIIYDTWGCYYEEKETS